MTAADLSSKRVNRSFVLRQGRMTDAQKAAQAQLWEQYGLAFNAKGMNVQSAFECPQPLIVEVGFGMGHSLVAMAKAQPHHNFLGIEVHLPGVARTCMELAEHGLKNVRLVRHDALDVLEHGLTEGSVDKLLLLFPDPWPKKRHHKRRIVQTDFIERVHRVLVPQGVWHVATDWDEYAQFILEKMDQHPLFDRLSPEKAARHVRVETKFERRGLRLGHAIHDLHFSKR